MYFRVLSMNSGVFLVGMYCVFPLLVVNYDFLLTSQQLGSALLYGPDKNTLTNYLPSVARQEPDKLICNNYN